MLHFIVSQLSSNWVKVGNLNFFSTNQYCLSFTKFRKFSSFETSGLPNPGLLKQGDNLIQLVNTYLMKHWRELDVTSTKATVLPLIDN